MTTLDRVFSLLPFSELRVRTTEAAVKVMLLRPPDETEVPHAEVFGTELLMGVPVTLPLISSVSIFTCTGCRIRISAPPATLQDCVATTAGAVWMRSVTDVHSHLEVMRQQAKSENNTGPRILFVSDSHEVGTSTYVRLLAQFAVRLGYHPLVLDGAASSPAFGYPECLSLYNLQYPIDVEEGMSFVPGVFLFSGPDKEKQPELFSSHIRSITPLVNDKMSRSDRCCVGGLLVDYGVISRSVVLQAEQAAGEQQYPVENPIDTLLQTVMQLDVDQIFVVQSAWLHFKVAQRAQELFGPERKVMGGSVIPSSEVSCDNGLTFKLFLLDGTTAGRMPITPDLRTQVKWSTYFFGTSTSPLKPERFCVEAWKVRIASLGVMEKNAASTFTPMADEEHVQPAPDPCSVTFHLLRDTDLRHRVMAVSTAVEYELLSDGKLQALPFSQFESDIKSGMVKGFAVVEAVTDDKVTLLVSNLRLEADLGVCLFMTTNSFTY